MQNNNVFNMGIMAIMIAALMLVPTVASGLSGNDDGPAEFTDVLIFDQGKGIAPLLSRLNLRITEDYGGYVLAQADDGALTALAANGIYTEYPTYRIGLESASFDTSHGMPPLPEGLALDRYPGETGYYIIQMIGPVKAQWISVLESEGIRVVEYLNSYAAIAEASPGQIESISHIGFVNWAGLYQPAYKLSPALEKHGILDIEVSLFRGESVRDAALELQALGLGIREFTDYEIGGIVRANAPAHLLYDIAGLKSVSYISPSVRLKVHNNAATTILQSGTTSGSRVIFDRGIRGEGQLISFSDTGLYMPHEMFSDTPNTPGPDHRKVYAYYTAGGHEGDFHGHGTHVAGTIAGDRPGYLTYNTPDGNAYAAKLIVADIGKDDGSLYVPNYDAVWNPAYVYGSRIMSNSWGSEYPATSHYQSDARGIDMYVWNNPDFLFVWAAGNAGSGSYTIGTQNQAKNIINVGGTDRTNPNNMYTSSSRGPTLDGRISPHVLAPAVSINSARWNTVNDYRTASGTSMAAPAVAGSAALIRQYLEEGWYPLGVKGGGDAITDPSAALMKSLLMISGRELTSTGAYANGENFYPNNQQGWGRVCTDDVLHFSDQTRKLLFWDGPAPLATGGSWEQKFTVESGTVPLTVMLSWSDYPASAGANPAIINDLDLTLTDANNNVYKGNVFTGSNPGRSTTGGSYDRLDTHEGVILVPGYGNGVPAGEYTITVSAHSVSQGPQDFAVAVVGGVRVAAPAAVTGLSVEHWGQDITQETRYMRGDTHTVNGLTAYHLGTEQSDIVQDNGASLGMFTSLYAGIRVWRRTATNNEFEITSGTAVAIAYSTATDLWSETWTPPYTALAETDSIVVRVYVDTTAPPVTQRAEFVTEQLGAEYLDENTWTVSYYLTRAGSPTGSKFYWGTDLYNSRIDGFQHHKVNNPHDHNTLNWTHTGFDTSHYNVYRSDTSTGPWGLSTLIDTVPVGPNTYLDPDKGQADAVRWWYVVRAVSPGTLEEQNTNAKQEPEGSGPTPQPYAIDLTGRSPGDWAFVSFPVAISGNIVDILNDPDGTDWDVAKWWDGSTQTWKTHRKGWSVNTFTTIDNKMGVWVHLTAVNGNKLTLGSSGDYPGSDVAIQLYAGWNMVGYPSATSRAADVALGGTGADLIAVYQSLTPYIQDVANLATVTMTHGNAYWVRVPADTVWTVDP